ncbi:hypothetical protein L211DRAFT_790211 [Terfezia boudieri ATCC MYA-4762]|uniref:L domain-like protein n=1 Tax=Terfezia boudieri ATCC MYA-4762 TaxID=1051890 RepID=A0A3N4LFK7_9PEZI|nr:hypothetical protein L211DRAFT_790211 [Terfezia boudieri ATCC MYA-4762]
MESEDGKVFIKHLAHYVRTHEKALANALQLQRRSVPARPNVVGSAPTHSPTTPTHFASSQSASSALAAALSLPSLSFSSQNAKPVKLSLTPHHLFYLLTRFQGLNISVGPMDVRLESLRAEASHSSNRYVSFNRTSRQDIDNLSIHSTSSVRSVMSGVSSLWSSFGLGGPPSASKIEKSKLALEADLKYLYSAFTKIPCLKLAPDRKAKLVEGFEEFPFDTAVPLLCFKNVSALEITDIDIRQFFGWDQIAERVRSLSVRKGGIEDVAELIIAIVLDDMDKRRRRSSKAQSSPIISHSPSPAGYSNERESSPIPAGYSNERETSSAPPSPKAEQAPHSLSGSAPASHPMSRGASGSSRERSRPRSSSPTRGPNAAWNTVSHHRSSRMRRSGSGGSHSSTSDVTSMGTLPASKWRFLRHLCLAENNLTSISTTALAPLASSLTSLDLSSNHFNAVPDAINVLSNLRALNLSNNTIDSLHSLTRNPLPAITAFNLRANRLSSLAGIERLLSLERVDLRDNALTDPTELARLTSAPNIAEIWVAHNPFTKTHASYRITIFNLFRSTPGYTEDIILDGSGPGMVERRSLIDRVAEPPNPPVIKPPQHPSLAPTKIASVEAKKRDDSQFLQQRDSEKSIHLVPQGQVARARKKGGRRRVVELMRDDPTPQYEEHSPNAASQVTQTQLMTPRTISMEGIPHETIPAPVPRNQSTTDPLDWELRGDEFRKRVEALKSEVGSGWLTVLSEEGWDRPHGFHQFTSDSITPPASQISTPLTL